ALGLGVNLPATHVIIRDPTFPGIGPVSTTDLLQMMGRAGRGERQGTASVILRSGDDWASRDLADALRAESLPRLVSCFETLAKTGGKQPGLQRDVTVDAATQIAAQLARRPEDGLCPDDLRSLFDRSLGGKDLANHVRGALAWLSDPTRALSFEGE